MTIKRASTLSTPNYMESLEKRYEELTSISKEKEKALQDAPQGNIHIAKRGKSVQYYIRKNAMDTPGEYMSKADTVKSKAYIRKKYDMAILKLVKSEITLMNSIITKCKETDERIRDEYSKMPDEIKQYIYPVDCSDDDYIKEWISQPYVGKEIGENEAVYITERGERVRSKSELNIANMLFRMKIPYKYECPLRLKNGFIIYPDFTVLNVNNRKTIYWEHRGMMDDREYAKHAIQRIKEYQKSDILLGRDLIISEESSLLPLGTNDIEMIIKSYLL